MRVTAGTRATCTSLVSGTKLLHDCIMFRYSRWWLLLLIGNGCALPETTPLPPVLSSPGVHVISHGWHTGVVLRVAELPADSGLPLADFPHAEYIEFGWGERDYYRARFPGPLTTLRAALVPSPGVLHVVGFAGPVTTAFPQSEVVHLPVTTAGLAHLVQALHASFERDASGELLRLGPGLYGDSRFYGSVEPFDLNHNCNAWTAKILNTAGLPIEPAFSATGIISNASRLAHALGGHAPPD